jgi:hypothetical protein
MIVGITTSKNPLYKSGKKIYISNHNAPYWIKHDYIIKPRNAGKRGLIIKEV